MKHKPKLGQNFLVDPGASQRIADAAGDVSNRTVLEIGPGHGAITMPLLARCGHLIAIELDTSLFKELQFRFRDRRQVQVLHASILETKLESLLEPGEKAIVVGNLPYYITSDILLKLFGEHAHIDRAVLMVQREVADRVAAAPGSRDYGLLSATAQMYASVQNLFTLPPSAFSPPPEVHSSVLRMTFAPRFEELGVDAIGFDRFLHQCFAQKRKTLANNLRATGHEPEAIRSALDGAGISPQARAEATSLEAMAALYKLLPAADKTSVGS